ncbi:MAG: phytanoyl-CoA dioxygenase family protein, partial [Actinobacteria bacterium]|nr:phytanoyl-CoA dioxygenase family protein [Actinomycetota bacterium]
ILKGAFSPRLADDLKATLLPLIADGPPPNLTAAHLLGRGELFEEIAVHPWVLTLAEKLAGPGCLLGQSLAFTKAKGIDTHDLHSDYALVPEPFPEQCLNVTSIWALDDFTETSGSTVVVPGSHKRNCHPTADASTAHAVKIIMPKGSVALWHGATWHGAAVRQDDGDRLSLHNSYFRYFTRPFDSYLDIDPAVLERNSPTVTTLCGLDDPFEKNSFKGPNRERLNYARRNYSAAGS